MPKDWSFLDKLIKTHLPHMTVKQFVDAVYQGNGKATYVVRKVSQRAKEIGVKPSKYRPTDDHKRATGKGATKYHLTTNVRKFLQNNYDKMPVIDMVRHLKVSRYCINKWLSELDLKVPDYVIKQACTERSKEHINKAISASAARWKDPEFRAKRSKAVSNNARKLWMDPAYRDKTIASLRKDSKRPEKRELISTKSKERYENDPDVRRVLEEGRRNQIILKKSRINEILLSTLHDLSKEFDIKNIQQEYELGNYHFDAFVEINGKKVLVEAQGDYWHRLPENIKNDKAKATFVHRYYKDYEIKYIWEHEFNANFTFRLKQVLGIEAHYEQIDFDFQDISITEVDSKEVHIFLSKYHYLHELGRMGKILGCYLEDELIAVCCFASILRRESAARLGFKQNETLELSRFAIHPNYQKKNFASWFISRAIKKVKTDNLKAIISFADKSVGHIGTIYKASGFEYDGDTPRSYHYMDDEGKVYHKKTIYNRAKKEGIIEREYSENNSLIKIYDNGKYRYVYKF